MAAAVERLADKGNSKLTLLIQTREVMLLKPVSVNTYTPNELITSIRRHRIFLNGFQISNIISKI